MLAKEKKAKSPFRFGEKHTEAKASYAFLMRKARTHKTKGFRLARIYPSFGARPHSVSYPRGEVSDAKHSVLHKPPFAFTPSQAQSAKRCASEREFLLFLLSRTEGKLPSIKDFLFLFLVSLQETGAPRVAERKPRGLSGNEKEKSNWCAPHPPPKKSCKPWHAALAPKKQNLITPHKLKNPFAESKGIFDYSILIFAVFRYFKRAFEESRSGSPSLFRSS